MDYSRLKISVILLVGVIGFGTFGYHWVDRLPFFDAFYMTLITISTVGFSEIRPLSLGGRFRREPNLEPLLSSHTTLRL